MAAATITLTNVKVMSSAEGKREVSATVDFDTGDYAANGLPLATISTTYPVGATTSGLTATSTGLLAALGFKQIDDLLIRAAPSVNAPYTQAQWNTANGTVTYGYFLDNGTNGTPKAPLLKINSAGAELGAVALAATAQLRVRFIGS